ncbi:MAG: Ditrans,polycis-undecaprenyl-diphosphate synthase ((2E,6E)-farnesyl-diphosphate specific) [Alphaproteobacteria bacterium MarineAlpha10_Bin2]|nr:MAG: Ditrans,polycis-undecaprenyl-diphosphate synthase ((2E,6E)-farnesyl-diphosphate specific) [Alphaproteobacteria bacterium MarineAlpha10_Bin2]
MALAPEFVDPVSVPRHVAIIMDGNGRWARARGLPRIAGHKQGAEAVRSTVRACSDLGISYLTIYAFSSENWKRPASEVDDLMGLLRLYIRRELASLGREGVRIRFIGDRSRLDGDINRLISESEENTKNNKGLIFTVALNYGGRQEILEAARVFAQNVRDGTLDPEDMNEQLFESYLQSTDMPDPDLLIRTSGEQRLSNFLLWQSAYTEFLFTSTLWPDFKREHLEQAVHEYQHRERRYGGSSD